MSMNFVLIQFLARSGLEIGLILVQIAVSQVQKGSSLQTAEKWTALNLSLGAQNDEEIMDRVEDKQSAEGRQGLQFRRSYCNMVEPRGLESVEMRREGSSGQSSITSQSSVASLAAESSIGNEAVEVEMATVPGQPVNFGTVVPGVYRSSYPQEADYPFLQKLCLKTIVTLVDKDIPETFKPFMRANGITHRHITMEGTKKQAIPVLTMAAILQVVHDKRNHPILIHCNQGRHRTGCVVAITRKLQQWPAERILEEYKLYANPKIRDGDVDYIEKFAVTDIEHLGLVPLTGTLPIETVRPRPRPLRLYIVAGIIILVFLSLSGMPDSQPTSGRNPLGI